MLTVMASKIRDRIITHAIRCFADDGYSGCSTKRIAEKANVTEGSLFRLCISKEKLFTEALTTALACKKIKRAHLRIAAFAVLESRGLTPSNLTAIRRLAKSSPCIEALLAISK
jgi:AcrR family transcriptional regulator